MHKFIWLIGFFFVFTFGRTQELKATVSINHSQIGNSNQNYFKTLENALRELLNNTSWTSTKFSNNEKIDCVFLLNVNSFENNSVSGTLQVQFTRPVYNSTYTSPVLNFNDKDISFSYTEFESLRYNPNSYDSNLLSIMGFYVNMIMGMDADTFALEGGTEYYQAASSIASLAQQSNYKGWKQGDGTNTRYYFVNDILAGSGRSFRKALYTYHREGMDLMADKVENGRDGIYAALTDLVQIHNTRPNSFLMRIFFDAKTDEIVNIYSGVMDKNKKKVVETLNKISPLNSSKWNNL